MTQPTSGVEHGVEHGDGVEPAEPSGAAPSTESDHPAHPEHAEHGEHGENTEHAEHGEHEEHEEHESHGHSLAAWTAVVVILVGTVVMSLAVVFPSLTWFIVGAVIVVLGIVAGKVLAMAGYGDKASTYQAAHRADGHGAELPGRQQHDSGTQ
ncbi:MAG TPA: HGxxPAAW family protein [Lapillicoccus sp.]|nr:HGxxPAAW family protein [Lapillicoccus sp.]